MWCFVSESPSVVREYRIPHSELGQVLYDKVCEDLGLLEKSYFGLRYRSKRGELLWLNLRNPLVVQLRGRSPHRLSLQVKFFVSPQELQQPITRHIFYLTLKNRLLLGHYAVTNEEKIKLFGLIAQAELGDADQTLPTQYHTILPDLSEETINEVLTAHREVMSDTMTPTYAEIQFIGNVSKLPGYGVEYFCAETKERVQAVIGVCTTGLQILTQARELMHSIKYEDISKVSYHQNHFSVHYYRSSGGTGVEDVLTALKFRLSSRKIAQALFRAFTESHTFFRCESVERVVRQQHSHTGFGSFLVLMKPDTSRGKVFRFDVGHTRRQAYDSAWRKLHPGNSPTQDQRWSLDLENYGAQRTWPVSSTLRSTHSQEILLSRQPTGSQPPVQIPKPPSATQEDDSSPDSTPEGTLPHKASRHDGGSPMSAGPAEEEMMEKLQDQLSNLQESRLCQVCLDNEMTTVFCPCGHMFCCETCSKECNRCPVCRAEVIYVQRVFFS
ncbi:E3 ubiquitin-protein ligase MYLIP [Strongylocentrotus purpuratus]|uniref:RING-type E3 ubiquitin transferase n=1 Tax=Strongylocentrotus purpuratus TaxID=7668 RepID=A0A7M7P6E8_STRPU|nr:E3 ubiquitin-protein ligase MYLIP [Strongylocentrotus purpuratus]|eukprot:XP_781984.3 PREDICTED: E3 ubiquitin-protein ligase MYLIP [Strongylocentrotus purpuratus]